MRCENMNTIVNRNIINVNSNISPHTFISITPMYHTGHDQSIVSMAKDSGESVLLTGSNSGAIAVWSLSKSPVQRHVQYNEHSSSVFSLHLLPIVRF